MKKIFFIFMSMVSLSSCSSVEEIPQGIGSDMDALKKSACPCGDIFYRNGHYL